MRKEQRDEKGKIKSFNEGELVLWMLKARRIKRGKFILPWKVPFKIQKMFDNNMVQLSTINNERAKTININKLKVQSTNQYNNSGCYNHKA